MLSDLEGMTGDTGEKPEEMNAEDAEVVGLTVYHLLQMWGGSHAGDSQDSSLGSWVKKCWPL